MNTKQVKIRTEKRTNKITNVLSKRFDEVTIVMENINDVHNLSAAIRSCDAVGMNEINVIYYGSQKMPKLGNKSSASAKKWVKINYFNSIDECYSQLRKEGKKIYTTKMDNKSHSLYDLQFDSPMALVFGNEHSGISYEAHNKADGNFLIPQVGMIQSLNISVAVAVSVYEVYRQRNNKNLFDNLQLEQNKYNSVLKAWLEK